MHEILFNNYLHIIVSTMAVYLFIVILFYQIKKLTIPIAISDFLGSIQFSLNHSSLKMCIYQL